jgi:hypothetical protein
MIAHPQQLAMTDPYPVLPGSVYVWRGFKSPAKSYEQFAQFLGSVFVPACALLQPQVGLRAYLPTMVPQVDKPAAVPDQTALMFWATPEAHDLANRAIAVRIYQNLHGDAYDLTKSHTPEVPQPISAAAGGMVTEQPYYLLNEAADWMLGDVHHLVGARRPDLTPADFIARVHGWAAGFHVRPPDDVDGALVCCGNDYVVAWAHTAHHGPPLGPVLDALAALTTPVLRAAPRPLHLPAGLWNDWPGLDLTRDACINVQFTRPPAASTIPAKPGAR